MTAMAAQPRPLTPSTMAFDAPPGDMPSIDDWREYKAMAPPDGPATDKQKRLLAQLMQSSEFTDDEAGDALSALAIESRNQITVRINRALARLAARERRQKAARKRKVALAKYAKMER